MMEYADTGFLCSLYASHSERLGTRSLDILHVAAALVLGCGTFHTFDARQAKLAKAAGLRKGFVKN